MGLFSKLQFSEAKDKLLADLDGLQYEIVDENVNFIAVKLPFEKNERYLKITLASYKSGRVMVDVYDSFYILHIPRREFKSSVEFRQFICDLLSTI